jgi:hypothetical protein
MRLDKNMTERQKAERLCGELDRLKAERAAFEGAWQDAQQLVSSVALEVEVSEGASTRGFSIPKRITNLPANYQETLVSGLCGYAVNPNITWMKLGLADQDALRGYGVKDWLQAVEQAEYEEMDNSSFYTEMKMVVEQATTFGVGIMSIDEDLVNGQVRYRQINAPEVYLDTNEHNEYETVFRRFFLSVENAVSRFGLKAMHQHIRDQWTAEGVNHQTEHKEIEILHAVFRRKNAQGDSERNTEMPFASFYVDTANRHIIEESGYRSFPYAIFCWDRVGGKKYPVSPAIKAINDIKLLHKTEDTRLTLAQMAARQPIAVPETMRRASEIFGADGYIRPGAVIYYDQGDAAPAGINMGGNYPITLDITRQQAENIKDWFFVDFFLMLQQQGNVNQMTATAVQALQGEKAAVMTNMIVNLKKALHVVVQRTYDIMSRQGRLPEVPQALRKPYGQGGNRMKFTFSSVLSQIQQAALRYQGAQRFLPVAQAVAQFGAVYPPALEALDRFDFDVILQNEARAASMPETAIREDEDVQAIQRQRAQAQAAQQQLAMRQQAEQTLAQNYTKLNEPPQPGSPAEAMLEQGGA